MKNLVFYKSQYGSTKEYAQWISEDLDCPVDDFANMDKYDIQEYDAIIFGEGIYAGKLNSPKRIKEIIRKYPQKTYAFFLVGLADMTDVENTNKLYADLEQYMGDDIKKIKVFFLRGAIDYKKLSFKHRSMMWMLHQSLKRKSEDELPKDAEQFLASYGKKVDFTDKATINPLINYVNNTQTKN